MYGYLKHGRLAGVCVVLFLAGCSTKPAEVAQSAPPPAAAPQVQSSIVPGSEQDLQTNVGDTIHFDYNSSSLQEGDKAILQRQATWLQKYASVRVTIQGNCDERGTREYNLALGARRADAVKEYLTSLGVSTGRIDTISYGKERPICAESTEACWAKNRRAVTVITGGASS
ncbi:MAG: peptidoglycan-associated lipoprotein Pal [Alphaproteobacteria bacterium]|nr:peptidoglycan-associated lipoprotein Pal [Alphaproteobacteria bacterium]MDE1986193.1 peptidoglycan-associated lipoprotein Pal [Alphaproteobacteria bacterium]MDE2163295.1 peptidoglycan-associated lipoprotein Pal [Alphaproteobacteria bacterium]MDE2266519.1 peptidoglycan-associated lipoprotein Pal [Alphaproteobacteria bacterium]MDE2498947.1 peptidoglycan-associated lipoprotein Pal [Alphaproteobacteria bacterium]